MKVTTRTTMSPIKPADRRWEGAAELSKNIEAMEDAVRQIHQEEIATIEGSQNILDGDGEKITKQQQH